MANEITGHTHLAGFFASPARHSVSPLIYNTAFEKTGLDCTYLAFEVDKESLPKAIESIRTLDMLWVNLSMPNKQLACEYMDELSPAAELIGAINTIVNDNGKLVGHNTDGIGFMDSVRDLGLDLNGKKMTILGAGGAATAIISQAALDGVKEISVFNIKDDFFETSKHNLEAIQAKTNTPIHLYNLADEEKLAQEVSESALFANATKVGMKPMEDQCPIKQISMLRADLLVADIIYNPRETKLLAEAKKIGCKTTNGLGMLLFQGAAAFKLGTGKEMPVEIIKPIILNA